MKLSEAIRLGAMNRPQATGIFFDGVGTCANGAALDAIGRLDTDNPLSVENNHALRESFPIVANLPATCPVCGTKSSMWWNREFKIAHLNDKHDWTREQIADWVETIERRADAESVGTQQETATTSVSFAPKD